MTDMHPDNEAALEEAILDLFTELGWQVLDGYYEVAADNIFVRDAIATISEKTSQKNSKQN